MSISNTISFTSNSGSKYFTRESSLDLYNNNKNYVFNFLTEELPKIAVGIFDLSSAYANSKSKGVAISVKNEENILQNINLAKLDEMLKLEENWDGENSASFDQDFIEKIRDLMLALGKRQPDIFPNASGGVELEYYSGEYSLVFEITGKRCQYLISDGEDDENDIYEEFEYDRNRIIEIVNSFYKDKFYFEYDPSKGVK